MGGPNKTRLVLTCNQHSISSGVFFNRKYAEQAQKMLEVEFPGSTWKVAHLEDGFKPEGYRHLGEHGVRRALARKHKEQNQ